MFTRKNVVNQAKTWLGTRFRYQGRIKKNQNNNGGVDCLGLIFGVCDELGYKYDGKLLSEYDKITYSKKPDYTILRKKFSEFFKTKNIEKIDVGDIVLKKLSEEQSHLMIYTGISFIHASANTMSVVEHGVDNLDECVVYSMF